MAEGRETIRAKRRCKPLPRTVGQKPKAATATSGKRMSQCSQSQWALKNAKKTAKERAEKGRGRRGICSCDRANFNLVLPAARCDSSRQQAAVDMDTGQGHEAAPAIDAINCAALPLPLSPSPSPSHCCCCFAAAWAKMSQAHFSSCFDAFAIAFGIWH